MTYAATVFNVMIASPGDVENERAIVREIVKDWNVVNAQRRHTVLLPLSWETHSSPTMGRAPQQIINEQVLDRCDLLVGVFWTRLGTPTTEYPSGTVEEIEKHIAAGRPAMLYFSSTPVALDSVDPKQYEELKKFRETCKARGLFETYDGPAQFREKFSRQLQLKINDDRYFHATEANLEPALPLTLPRRATLSNEARTLLKDVSTSNEGYIMRLNNMGGVSIQTAEKSYTESHSARSVATWDAALQELERQDLIEPADRHRTAFRVTRQGYEMADSFPR